MLNFLNLKSFLGIFFFGQHLASAWCGYLILRYIQGTGQLCSFLVHIHTSMEVCTTQHMRRAYFHGSMLQKFEMEEYLAVFSKYAPYRQFIQYSEKATKIWQNLQILFEIMQQRQKKLEMSSYFCGPLKIYELQKNTYVHTRYVKREYTSMEVPIRYIGQY